jgi:NADP-dependent 3-hydroxy acid dehydrogenase YdfG
MTTWFSTGASSGLGAPPARADLDHGQNAVITARNAYQLQDLVDEHPTSALAVPSDVTDHDQVIIATVEGERAPFHLLLGTDAVTIVRDKLRGRVNEINQRPPVSATTDFAYHKKGM